MPQVFIILGPETKALFTDDEVNSLGKKLILVTEAGFGIAGKKDGAFTAIRAVSTENEADIQIEVRYTAGEDEYGKGKPFDPTREEQRDVAESIKKASWKFFKDKGLPKYSISIWVKPSYNGTFVSG